MAEQRAPRLELTWPNMDWFLLVPKDADGKPVWVGRDHLAAHEVRLSTVTGHTALFTLPGELPAALVAQMLGIHITGAARGRSPGARSNPS